VFFGFDRKGPVSVIVMMWHIGYGTSKAIRMPYEEFVKVYRSVLTANQWETVTRPVRDFIPKEK
jgi:hypothetical protein